MLNRCQNPKAEGFRYYGGRGIAVCERWRQFDHFIADLGRRPPGTSLERIDNNGPYEPGNCRWARLAEQNRNRSMTVWLTLNGETLCMTDWATRIGMTKATLFNRLKAGWSIERALTTPARRYHERPPSVA